MNQEAVDTNEVNFDPSMQYFFQPVRQDGISIELHWADKATIEVLVMARRSDLRDALDVLSHHKKPISLGALIWAASGKDDGLGPMALLDQVRRHARVTPDDVKLMNGFDPQVFGVQFRQAAREAEMLIQALPPETIGHLFLDGSGQVIEPDPDDPESLSRPLAPRKGGLIIDAIDSPSP